MSICTLFDIWFDSCQMGWYMVCELIRCLINCMLSDKWFIARYIIWYLGIDKYLIWRHKKIVIIFHMVCVDDNWFVKWYVNLYIFDTWSYFITLFVNSHIIRYLIYYPVHILLDDTFFYTKGRVRRRFKVPKNSFKDEISKKNG